MRLAPAFLMFKKLTPPSPLLYQEGECFGWGLKKVRLLFFDLADSAHDDCRRIRFRAGVGGYYF